MFNFELGVRGGNRLLACYVSTGDITKKTIEIERYKFDAEIFCYFLLNPVTMRRYQTSIKISGLTQSNEKTASRPIVP